VQYVFVLRGRLGGTLEPLLQPVSVDVRADSTQMVVDARDDSEVYSILERLERLGMSIISFAQEPSSTSDQGAACAHEKAKLRRPESAASAVLDTQDDT
jgi:hypothetical protein